MEKKRFEYQYCAPTEQERRVAQKLKQEYSEQNGGIERLQTLDNKVKKPPMYVSIAFGVIGTLVFGGGFSLVLEFQLLWQGCAVSLVGLGFITLAYPVYKVALKRSKKKYGKEIVALAEELLKNE